MQCFTGLYLDQYLNVQLTDVTIVLKARMLYDVYGLPTVDELSSAENRIIHTYGVNFIRIMPA